MIRACPDCGSSCSRDRSNPVTLLHFVTPDPRNFSHAQKSFFHFLHVSVTSVTNGEPQAALRRTQHLNNRMKHQHGSDQPEARDNEQGQQQRGAGPSQGRRCDGTPSTPTIPQSSAEVSEVFLDAQSGGGLAGMEIWAAALILQLAELCDKLRELIDWTKGTGSW